MKRENVKDWMLIVGGLLMFGSVALLAMVWLSSWIWPVLPWTLLAGLIVFGAAVMWIQAAAGETVEPSISDDLPKAA